jgi:DUF1680 family protein
MPSAKRQLTPVRFTEVHFDDHFWAPRIETNRAITIPHIHQMLVDSGRIAAFDLNFAREVPSPVVLIFGDSDPGKWIEAASHALATRPDPTLARTVDLVADRIISAQQPDGYLNTHFTAIQPDMKWRNLRDWHEMYCAGHLMEGAVAHFQATGDRKLLDALARYADHIDATFGRAPGKKRGYDGHPEVELALVKLAHATGERRYLDLAKYMVDERGQQPHYYDIEARERGDDPAKFWAKTYEYCQAHRPIREQEQAVGHAVRAMYLFSGVADLAHEYDDPSLLAACERIWDAMVSRRMYLTGGIGPSHSNEGFTRDYDLPDESAYAETCAAIGLVFWGHRMLQFTGDGKYADVIERALYNGALSGVSLEGTHFFYENPLASIGHHHRVPWFWCPCCPPNVARLIASVGDYFYSTGPADAWVHLYGQTRVALGIGGSKVEIAQRTGYPWNGDIQLELDLAAPKTFALHLRIPGWCDTWRVRVNGEDIVATRDRASLHQGYLAITREWKAGDRVQLSLDMPLTTVWAHPAVRQMAGRFALQRGPLVYCLEGLDHNGVGLERVSLDAGQAPGFGIEHHPELLGGVTVLRGRGSLVDDAGWDGQLYRRNAPPVTRPIDILAVPYYAWDNRSPGEMRVWFRAE